MPTFTIEVPEQVAGLVAALARTWTPEAYIAEVLTNWAQDKFAENDRFVKAMAGQGYTLVDGAMVKTGASVPLKPREKDIELAIAADCLTRGLTVLRQVRTPQGVADLVVGDAVVEVKLELTSWREVHQAVGQARGYAGALGLPRVLVCAPGVAEKFRSAEVCAAEDAAELLAS